MSEVIELKRGDPCPACGGTLVANPVPTDEQRAAAEDRERREPLPHRADSANAKQRAQLGELFTCDRCDYHTRFPLEAKDSLARGASKRVTSADATKTDAADTADEKPAKSRK